MKRIVVKIGSNALTDKNGQLNKKTVARISAEICDLKKNVGYDFVIVTSGAVSTGRSKINKELLGGSNTLNKQTLAAVGQPLLIASYAKAFESHNVVCAQVLLTRYDFSNTKRRNTLSTLINLMLKNSIVPIINENDAISSEELQNVFTDNDQLASLLAIEIKADKLVILSDVDGLFNGSPSDPASEIISVVQKSEDYMSVIDDNSGSGRGGMKSKLLTAKKITQKGIEMHIGNGKKKNTITRIIKNEQIGTLFSVRK